MRRVLHLAGHLRFGAGRFIADLAASQRARGAQVDVLVSTDAESPWQNDPGLIDELREHGVGCTEVGDTFHRAPGPMLDAASRLRHHCDHWTTTTVVHAHSAMTAAIAAWAGAPAIVTTCHGWNPRRDPAFDLQDALALRWPGLVITSPSANWAEAVRRVAGVPAEVVSLGFDLARFPEPARRADAAPRVVTIAELSHRKGIDVMIEAMPHVWSSCPHVQWHLFGTGELLDLAQRFAAEVNTPAHTRCVVHGPVRHAHRDLGRNDIFCLPSRSDNLPVAIIEALLMGAPVVATGVGGVPELAATLPSISTVPPADPLALATAVVRLLEMKSDARRSVGEHARRAARVAFDIETVCGRYDELYERVCATSGLRR